MLDPIPSLPRSNQALEWNQLFESRDQHVVVAGPWLDPIGQERVWVRPKRGEREKRGARLGGGARWSKVAGGGGSKPTRWPAAPLVWFGQREERGEESKRERERYVGMIDERENEWRGVYIIPSPR